MKVRWTEESLRLRITPSELTQLEQHVPIEAALILAPNGGWRVALAVATVTQTALTQEGNLLHLHLSTADLDRLSAPEAEGIYFAADRAEGIRYYIEKDFPCVHPRGVEALEPPTETFAPPDDFEERKA